MRDLFESVSLKFEFERTTYMEDGLVKGPIENASDKLLREFVCKTERFKSIETSIVVKHLTSYSVITINCSTLDKKWFFHTVSRFTDDRDFYNLRCLLKGIETSFQYLEGDKFI